MLVVPALKLSPGCRGSYAWTLGELHDGLEPTRAFAPANEDAAC